MFYRFCAVPTHTGFEGIWPAGLRWLDLGNLFHQMHHRCLDVTHGALEAAWYKLFGPFDKAIDDATARFKQRPKERRRG